jgi:hypothetical protein
MKPIVEDGKFGGHTRDAVILFQKQFHLKMIDGKVGNETRRALATRVLLLEGSMTRNIATPPPPPQPSPSPPPNPPQPPTPPTPAPSTPTASRWLLQLPDGDRRTSLGVWLSYCPTKRQQREQRL